MFVNVLSYEVNLPDGTVCQADGYDDIVSVINNYNYSHKIIPGNIVFPDKFDFVEFIMLAKNKVDLVVNDVVLGTISKVIKKEEI